MSDIFNIGFEGKCKGESNYMIKTYVIDTNVLIQAPYALECFEDNNLVLPLVVLEELDGLKKAEGEIQEQLFENWKGTDKRELYYRE